MTVLSTNNILRIMKFLIVLFFLLGSAVAQNQQTTPKPTPPNATLPIRMPNMAIWSIKVTPVAAASIISAQQSQNSEVQKGIRSVALQELLVTKTWPVIHEEQVDSDGTRWDKWFSNGTQVTFCSHTNQPMVCTGTADNPFYFKDYTKSDFNGFEWVSKNYYQDVVSVDGRDYFYYVAKKIIGPGLAVHIASVDTKLAPDQTADDLRAYIDVNTFYPFRLIDGERQFDYQFGPAPKNMQTLPSNVQVLLNDLALKVKKMSAKPPQGF